MTNKLVVIINSLKVPKIKKILLYEMKFLVQNYSCLQNPWLGGYLTQIPVLSVLCPQLYLLNPPPEQSFWVRHWPLGSPIAPEAPGKVYKLGREFRVKVSWGLEKYFTVYTLSRFSWHKGHIADRIRLFSAYSPVEEWRHTVTHERGSEGETGEWSG